MHPNKEEKGGLEEKDKRDGGKEEKDNKEYGHLILGLRISRKRLHFLFRGHQGAIENWIFRGARLADNQWHTLVLAVGSHRVSLTVDCRIPLEM